MQYFHGIMNLQCDASLVSSVFAGGCVGGGGFSKLQSEYLASQVGIKPRTFGM